MKNFSRRTLLAVTGAAFAGGAAVSAAASAGLKNFSWRDAALRFAGSHGADGNLDWTRARALFPISPDWIDMSAMLLTSHPAPVAEAVRRHRQGLDDNAIVYMETHNRPLLKAACEAAAGYLGGVEADDIALTDSTTMGVALVYNGLRIKPGEEILTTEQDYYVTHESLRLASARNGATVRRIKLYDEAELGGLSSSMLVDRIIREIGPATRVIALTWVHSSTGLAVPVAEVSAALARINATRGPDDRVLLCVDGVHGVGVKDVSFAALGCDFLMSGCHKWLFGPRGTGLVAGTKAGWRRMTPTIPSFFDIDAYGRWMRNQPEAPDGTTAAAFMPGGFKSFEHLWALPEAFAFQASMGKARVAQRTAELASQLKEGLARMAHVQLHTPRSPELSAGIVAFDIAGRSPGQVVEFLRSRKTIASVAPYATPHVRLSPSVRNTPREIETVLSQLQEVSA